MLTSSTVTCGNCLLGPRDHQNTRYIFVLENKFMLAYHFSHYKYYRIVNVGEHQYEAALSKQMKFCFEFKLFQNISLIPKKAPTT